MVEIGNALAMQIERVEAPFRNALQARRDTISAGRS